GVNVDGVAVADDWFVSLDTDIRPTIAEDGSIDMGGLLELTDAAPSDAGARLGPNPDPTVIELLPPVGEDESGEPGDPGDPGDPGLPSWLRELIELLGKLIKWIIGWPW
ncbi:MAG TPA: hypothetical protein VK046_10200, partial [Actinomycetaceae bacterium]|nr:hypothetical protein [Actinomycetaceae bacterium]